MQVRKDFPEVEGIMTALLDATDGAIGKPFDLSNIPPTLRSIERKYSAEEEGVTMPIRKLQFQTRILELHNCQKFRIVDSNVFSGIDLYACLGGNGKSITKRLRFGSNRPAQLSTKVPIVPGDGEERGQFNVHVRHEDIQKVRADFTATAQLVENSKMFLIGQSGDFWFVRDEKDRLIEIALYKAGRAEADATTPLRLFAEIAPWGYPPMPLAVQIMDTFEEMLGLKGRHLTQSVADIFGS